MRTRPRSAAVALRPTSCRSMPRIWQGSYAAASSVQCTDATMVGSCGGRCLLLAKQHPPLEAARAPRHPRPQSMRPMRPPQSTGTSVHTSVHTSVRTSVHTSTHTQRPLRQACRCGGRFAQRTQGSCTQWFPATRGHAGPYHPLPRVCVQHVCAVADRLLCGCAGATVSPWRVGPPALSPLAVCSWK